MLNREIDNQREVIERSISVNSNEGSLGYDPNRDLEALLKGAELLILPNKTAFSIEGKGEPAEYRIPTSLEVLSL